jgi:hypothetical protein
MKAINSSEKLHLFSNFLFQVAQWNPPKIVKEERGGGRVVKKVI